MYYNTIIGGGTSGVTAAIAAGTSFFKTKPKR